MDKTYFTKDFRLIPTFQADLYISQNVCKLFANKKDSQVLSRKSLIFKWAHLESNQAPTDYESVALTE
jgi:hypothetical protein